eukprot:784009-Alexandrium_andersonii.AAC.1
MILRIVPWLIRTSGRRAGGARAGVASSKRRAWPGGSSAYALLQGFVRSEMQRLTQTRKRRCR